MVIEENIMEQIENYLLNEAKKDVPITLKETDKVAVIVEPREHKLLIGIIKNVMSNLGPDWNLQIFCGLNNIEFIKKNLPGDYRLVQTQVENFNHVSYSLYLRSTDFWERIKEENVLIFQTDSFICNNKEFPMEYGFLGASYSYALQNKEGKMILVKEGDHYRVLDGITPPNAECNINGGFSFRKKSVMMDCIKNASLESIYRHRQEHNLPNIFFNQNAVIQEDVFFINAISVLGHKIPSKKECDDFCSQNVYNPESFALHNFQKNYLTDEQLRSFVEPVNDTNTISYVNLPTQSSLSSINPQQEVNQQLNKDNQLLEEGPV